MEIKIKAIRKRWYLFIVDRDVNNGYSKVKKKIWYQDLARMGTVFLCPWPERCARGI